MDRVRVAVHCIYKLHFYCMENFTEKKMFFFRRPVGCGDQSFADMSTTLFWFTPFLNMLFLI